MRTTIRKISKVCVSGALAFSALLSPGLANAITVDNGYFGVFGLASDGIAPNFGAYQFGEAWTDLSKMRFEQSGTTVTLRPNVSLCADQLEGPDGSAPVASTPNPDYWCNNTVAGEPYGNKWVEFLAFEALPLTTAATSGNFKGCWGLNTLPAGYEVLTFVKRFDTGYSLLQEQYDGSACWNIDYTAGASENVQIGFIIKGPNGRPYNNNERALGQAKAYIGVTSPPGVGVPEGASNIPTLPLGGILGIVALLGLLGARRLK